MGTDNSKNVNDAVADSFDDVDENEPFFITLESWFQTQPDTESFVEDNFINYLKQFNHRGKYLGKPWLQHAINLSIDFAESNEVDNSNIFAKMFELMLRNNFPADLKDDAEMIEPLLYVARRLYLCKDSENVQAKKVCKSIINVLLHHNENIGINSRDKDNKTVLHYLILANYSQTKELLARDDLDLHNLNDDNSTIFHFLAEHGRHTHKHIFQSINVKCPGSVNKLDKELRTPLHISIEKNNKDAFKTFLELHGIDVNIKSLESKKPVSHFLCDYFKQRNVISKLTKVIMHDSFDVNTVGPNGKTLLHLACKLCSLEIIQAIYEHHLENIDFMKCDTSGKTFLFYGRDQKDILEYLLEETPQEKMNEIFKVQDKQGKTILHYYCSQEDCKKEIVSKILELGGLTLITIRDKNGNDPYFWARDGGNADIYDLVQTTVSKILDFAKDGNLSAVKNYLEQIKDEPQNDLGPCTKMSIFHELINSCTKKNLQERKEILSYILSDIDDDHIDKCGQTPLHYLADATHIPEKEILTIIQEVGLEVLPINSQCNIKKTPLHCAIKSSRRGITKFLLQSGKLIPGQVDKDKLNYLHYLCIYSKDDDSLSELCQAFTSNNNDRSLAQGRCNESKTPLYYAVSDECDKKFLRSLLKDFCSVEDVVGVHCEENLTPLMKALIEKQTDNALCLVEFLINTTKDTGSKVCLKKANNVGETALHLCVNYGNCDIFDKLFELFIVNNDIDSMKELLLHPMNSGQTPLGVIISERKIDMLCKIEEYFCLKKKLTVSKLDKEIDKKNLAFHLDEGGNWEKLYEGLSEKGHCDLEGYREMIRHPNFTKIGKIIYRPLETEYPSITITELKNKVNVDHLGRNDLCGFLDELMECVCAKQEGQKSSTMKEFPLEGDLVDSVTECCCAKQDIHKFNLWDRARLAFFLGKYHNDDLKSPEYLVDELFSKGKEHIKQRIAGQRNVRSSSTDALIEMLKQRNSNLSLISICEVLLEKNVDAAASKVLTIIENQVENSLRKSRPSAVENSE